MATASGTRHRLEHARHNKSASELLADSGYDDWVVTTCFYSAVHFVRYALFPRFEKLRDGTDAEFETFDAYRAHFRSGQPHDVLVTLVFKNLPDIYKDYLWLKQACWNARYKGYRVQTQTANEARRRLGRIEAACMTARPETGNGGD